MYFVVVAHQILVALLVAVVVKKGVSAKNLGTKLQRLGPLGTFCHSEAQEKVLTLNCPEIDWEMSLEVSLDYP